jgi:hypothetical protein
MGPGGSGDGAAATAANSSAADAAAGLSGEITAASPTPPEQQQQTQPKQAAAPAETQQQTLAPIRTDVLPLRTSDEQQRGSPGSSSSSSPSKRLVAAAAAPGSPGRTRMAGMNLPVLMVSSPESVEEVHPALMRLEAEGGMLLIEVRRGLIKDAARMVPHMRVVGARGGGLFSGASSLVPAIVLCGHGRWSVAMRVYRLHVAPMHCCRVHLARAAFM